MGAEVRDWGARRRLAEAHAAGAVARARGLDAGRPDLEELHPAEFAEAVHAWSLAHPVQTADPLLERGFDVRSGSGAVAFELARARTGAKLSACCGEWLLPEDMAVDPGDADWLLTRCRRCVAREGAAADA